MRHMARKFGEDEEVWGAIGLVHDLDYEQYPEQHCAKSEEILKERGWPEGLGPGRGQPRVRDLLRGGNP